MTSTLSSGKRPKWSTTRDTSMKSIKPPNSSPSSPIIISESKMTKPFSNYKKCLSTIPTNSHSNSYQPAPNFKTNSIPSWRASITFTFSHKINSIISPNNMAFTPLKANMTMKQQSNKPSIGCKLYKLKTKWSSST